MKSSKTKVILFTILGITMLAFTYTGFSIKRMTSSGFNIEKTVYIYIDEKKDYDKLLDDLRNIGKIEQLSAFERVSSFYDYPDHMKTGRYAITPSTNVRELVLELRGAHQTPVNLKFNNIRTKQDLATRIADQLMISENDLLTSLNDSLICSRHGFTLETIPSMFIPNTYQLYWDMSLESFLQRMKKEHDKFWTEARLAKAKEQNLSPDQAATLASIVEEECFFADEYSTVAGLYLNRYHRGQLLQADPTVKFAVGDFGLRRILFEHLKVDSPYNTYKYAGLPPGPIRIPSIKGIDAVLNPKTHEYLYMCAKEDFSGRHNFAKTHAEHERNAAKYRKALNQRGIYK